MTHTNSSNSYIRDVAVTAVAVTGTAELYFYELVTVTPFVANTWIGVELKSEVWPLSLIKHLTLTFVNLIFF